ncbi:hypothetical protein [Streptomyces sp. NPDC055692]|uniref:hypothetical protein n=1 Tax=Streptomyces sp. NPDC055692 TaxID=3155683 RepID=UPI0034282885
MSSLGSVGFRPTAADNEIIQAHRRPEESTSDVLRRALRALDREKWRGEALKDMERIAASGEDLSEEPDDWGFDDEGDPVDLRESIVPPREPVVLRGESFEMRGEPVDLRDEPVDLRDEQPSPARRLQWSGSGSVKSESLLSHTLKADDGSSRLHWLTAASLRAVIERRLGSELGAAAGSVVGSAARADSAVAVGENVFAVGEHLYAYAEPSSASIVKVNAREAEPPWATARRARPSWKVKHLRAVAARRGGMR